MIRLRYFALAGLIALTTFPAHAENWGVEFPHLTFPKPSAPAVDRKCSDIGATSDCRVAQPHD